MIIPPTVSGGIEGRSRGHSIWGLTRYFLRLGTMGFGGPVALVGYMNRDIVEQRGWIAGAVIVLGRRAIVDLPTATRALASLSIRRKFKRNPEPAIVLVAAAVGMLLYPLTHR